MLLCFFTASFLALPLTAQQLSLCPLDLDEANDTLRAFLGTEDAIWVVSGTGLHRVTGESALKLAAIRPTALAQIGSELWYAYDASLYRVGERNEIRQIRLDISGIRSGRDGLTLPRVHTLVLASDRLWVGTESGLFASSPLTVTHRPAAAGQGSTVSYEIWHPISEPLQMTQILKGESVLAITWHAEHGLLVGTSRSLYRIATDSGTPTALYKPVHDRQVIREIVGTTQRLVLRVERSDQAYKGALIFFDPSDGSFIEHRVQVSAIESGPGNRLYVAELGRGLLNLSPSGWVDRSPGENLPVSRDKVINTLVRIPAGFLVGTSLGLRKISLDGLGRVNEDVFLIGGDERKIEVQAAYQSQDGRVWYATKRKVCYLAEGGIVADIQGIGNVDGEHYIHVRDVAYRVGVESVGQAGTSGSESTPLHLVNLGSASFAVKIYSGSSSASHDPSAVLASKILRRERKRWEHPVEAGEYEVRIADAWGNEVLEKSIVIEEKTPLGTIIARCFIAAVGIVMLLGIFLRSSHTGAVSGGGGK